MRSGFVAVAGRPNVGKSTLVNALCGGKVAIVSDKPQTTRRRIFGIANGDDYQLVLADLPGFQRPLVQLPVGGVDHENTWKTSRVTPAPSSPPYTTSIAEWMPVSIRL